MSGSGTGTPIVLPVTINELITKFRILYPNIDTQSPSEAGTGLNTDAEILYTSFDFYYNLAVDELANILDLRSITLTSTQEDTALCHLIADYFEMGSPDWSFSSQSMGSGVSFSRREKTGPREALDKLLDQVESAARATRRSGIRLTESNILRVHDHTHYPRRFKMTQIPTFDFSEDGFDSSETQDLGSDDTTY